MDKPNAKEKKRCFKLLPLNIFNKNYHGSLPGKFHRLHSQCGRFEMPKSFDDPTGSIDFHASKGDFLEVLQRIVSRKLQFAL